MSLNPNTVNQKPNCTHRQTYNIFLDLINDFGFSQMVTHPIRFENTLDLFLTKPPTLVDEVVSRPGISDHSMVYGNCALKPAIQKQTSWKVFLFNKADWPKFKTLIKGCHLKFLEPPHGKSVDDCWSLTIDSLSTHQYYGS